jgi:hypothetical protein
VDLTSFRITPPDGTGQFEPDTIDGDAERERD